MLEAKLRDIRKKGRTLRRLGQVTGTIRRKNGDIIPISMVMHKLETYVSRYGLGSKFDINFENETIKVKIDRVQRDILLHNIINVDVVEL
ncbi:hypothetical protein [Caproiciproducens sp. MSJ-32]|uniref:hypothetical protein n=1 Tax=Caproiciproducens sp. MSJ-32 TaxID=2841527 RepID=UPI001C106D0B|nr:hypothetical protein [Caproiciproducens sp. MSJ-32]MBU5453907.1 hypothetical protein [Caproiciproducens sp. MSJ-32]